MSGLHRLTDELHAAMVLPPVADAFAGTVTSAAAQMGIYKFLHFLIARGVGVTGTSTITVEACSAANGTGAEAIPYSRNKQAPGANTVDTWTGDAIVAAAGEDTPAGSHSLFVLSVDARDLPDGKPWVRVKGVEVVDSPCAGCIIVIASNAAFVNPTPVGVLS